jgi:hypothetical protein
MEMEITFDGAYPICKSSFFFAKEWVAITRFFFLGPASARITIGSG